MTLVEFLTARLDELQVQAERHVRLLLERHNSGPGDVWDLDHDLAVQAYLFGYNPDHVLADIEAKQLILEHYALHLGAERTHDYDGAMTADELEIVMQYLALPYADHPDYDEAWRP